MIGFKQFIEALSSHGGFWFQKDQPSAGITASDKNIKWSFPNYNKAEYEGKDDPDEKNARKTHEKLSQNYKYVIDKLDQRLVRLGDVNFHIYFGLPENIRFLLRGEDGREDVSRLIPVLHAYFFGSDGLNIPESDVVFVKSGPSGDPLTPWMVLHAVGHALLNRDSKLDMTMTTDINDMKNRFRTADILQPQFSCLFNFRSARIIDNQNEPRNFAPVTSDAELRHELIASYLWHGGKIKRPTEECVEDIADILYHAGSIRHTQPEIQFKNTQELIDNFYDKMDNDIKNALDNLKGKVLIDLFPYITDLSRVPFK